MNHKKCQDCEDCTVIENCPTDAFMIKQGKISSIDRSRCFNCGTCVFLCPKNAFNGDLKRINFKGNEIPVVLRQSDRNGAIKLANELKQSILKGEFELKEPTGNLEFSEKVI